MKSRRRRLFLRRELRGEPVQCTRVSSINHLLSLSPRRSRIRASRETGKAGVHAGRQIHICISPLIVSSILMILFYTAQLLGEDERSRVSISPATPVMRIRDGGNGTCPAGQRSIYLERRYQSSDVPPQEHSVSIQTLEFTLPVFRFSFIA